LIRIALRCPAESADRVLAELVELVPGGVEEERGDGWVEFAVYGPPGELPDLPELVAEAAGGEIEVSSTEIPDDWADRWRDFHHPIWLGDRLCVRPSWLGTDTRAAAVNVVIEPGQAFGTGAHATTRMCLELLLELADAGEATGALVDLGTGSGVLAIAAAKLGWEPVAGCDSELAALEAAAENAGANGVELALERVNLREYDPPAAPTTVANLTAPLLARVTERLAPEVGTVICSGLLASERQGVAEAFRAAGFRLDSERSSGEWAALLVRR
jgi:ribosomal protein L11 methyltransferase